MTASEQLAAGRYLFEHLLERVLVVYDKVIAALSRDRLAFRATLIAYGRAVRRYAGAVAAGLTAGQLERSITGDPGRSGLDAIRLAPEETIHHRGQLMTCLRLLGVVPPRLYDYS